MAFIYSIRNIVSSKQYIGKTIKPKVEHRWREHVNQLNRNDHFNGKLQAAWNKYGKEKFEFFVLETLASNLREDVRAAEQLYIDFFGMENLYNICPISEFPPTFNPLPESWKQSLKASFTPERRAAQSKQRKEHPELIVVARKAYSEKYRGSKWVCSAEGKSLRVQPEEVKSYLNRGWRLGHNFPQKAPPPPSQANTVWVMRIGENKSTRIKPESLEEYLASGWVLGRGSPNKGRIGQKWSAVERSKQEKIRARGGKWHLGIIANHKSKKCKQN